ncbi:MAG: tetratricopeptide repeat protein [Candidatus Spyradosoma sp.]
MSENVLKKSIRKVKMKNLKLLKILSVLVFVSLSGAIFPACSSGRDYYYQGDDHYGEGRYEAAFKSYLRAAEKGDVDGTCAVGMCYYDGIGTSKNFSAAVRYFRKASDMGSEDANVMLAVCYWKGEGVSANRNLAKQYARSGGSKGRELLSRMNDDRPEKSDDNSDFWRNLAEFTAGFIGGFIYGYNNATSGY